MGLSHTVISKDSGGSNMKNQVLILYIKRIFYVGWNSFLMLTSDFGNMLSADDLNKIEKVDF